MTDWRGKPWFPEGPRAAHLDARYDHFHSNELTQNYCQKFYVNFKGFFVKFFKNLLL